MVITTITKDLRSMTDEQLAEFMAGWRTDTGNYILSKMEFMRRQSRGNEIRGWISLALSALALILSVIALALH